jgi:hypothetical protein
VIDIGVVAFRSGVPPPEHPSHAPGNALEAVYENVAAGDLYAAAIRAATELGFPILARNDAATTVHFSTLSPTASWPTLEMTAICRQQADGSQVVVGAIRPTGYRLAMLDWHWQKSMSLLFLRRLAMVLSSARAQATDVPPPPSPAEQLQTLTELRDEGALTDEEFATAEQRLVG